MKTNFWKALLVLSLAMMLLCGSFALGEARYPVSGGVVTDDENALSQTMTRDIADYAQKLENETDVKVHVALVQFLDGETVQSYTDKLFTRWELGKDDLLIVGAAAEDSFAAASGADVKAKLSDASMKSLMYSAGFADAFRSQQYDAAFGRLFVSFNDLVGKQYGDQIKLGDLFADYQASAQGANAPAATQNPIQSAVNAVVDTSSQLWESAVNSVTSNVQNYQANSQRAENDHSLTPAGWIVLVVIAMIVFGQSGPARRARGRSGCGCSPIGWLLSGLGLGALFTRREWRDWRDREHRGPGGYGRRWW